MWFGQFSQVSFAHTHTQTQPRLLVFLSFYFVVVTDNCIVFNIGFSIQFHKMIVSRLRVGRIMMWKTTKTNHLYYIIFFFLHCLSLHGPITYVIGFACACFFSFSSLSFALCSGLCFLPLIRLCVCAIFICNQHRTEEKK